MFVGYARVSTRDQSPALQLGALREAGCERVFTEKASGAQRVRPERKAALEYIREGDSLVVWKLNRLARSVRQLVETAAINKLTVPNSGSTHVLDRIKLSSTRPQVVKRRESIEARKSLMNMVTGDNDYELAFARFLEDANDVQGFLKNTEATGFTMEYQAAGAGIIRNYLPDFVVRTVDGAVWIVETKGREDVQDARTWDRLQLWCADATEQDPPTRYAGFFVHQDNWEGLLNPVYTFGEAVLAFGNANSPRGEAQ